MAIKNERFIYSSRNFTTGLTDVTAKVRRNGVEVAASVALTEIANGRYELLLTTTLIALYGGEGFFDLFIDSPSQKAPATASRWILANNESDLESHLGIIEGKVNTVGTDVSVIRGEVQNGSWGLSQLKALIDSVQSSVSTIQNVTRFIAAVPSEMTRPATGLPTRYMLPMRLYDTAGNLEDPDSNVVTVSVTDEAGNDRSSYLTGYVAGPVNAIRSGLGVYAISLDIPTSAFVEQLVFSFSYTENAIPLSSVRTANVVSDVANSGFALEGTSQSILLDTQDVKPRVLNIQTQINSAVHGLAALKLLIDSVDLKNVNIRAELDSAAYGLSSIKTALDTKSSAAQVTAVQATADAIQLNINTDVKGTGFDASKDSLQKLSLRIYTGGQVL